MFAQHLLHHLRDRLVQEHRTVFRVLQHGQARYQPQRIAGLIHRAGNLPEILHHAVHGAHRHRRPAAKHRRLKGKGGWLEQKGLAGDVRRGAGELHLIVPAGTQRLAGAETQHIQIVGAVMHLHTVAGLARQQGQRTGGLCQRVAH